MNLVCLECFRIIGMKVLSTWNQPLTLIFQLGQTSLRPLRMKPGVVDEEDLLRLLKMKTGVWMRKSCS